MTTRRAWILMVVAAGCGGSEKVIETGRRYQSTTYNETVTESFDRSTRTITGVLVQTSGDSVKFRIRLAADDLVNGVDFTLHPATERDQHPQTRRIGMPKNTLPILGTSVAFLEQVVRRARAVGGDSVSVPVMQIGSQATLDVFTVIRNGPDSVVLVGPDGNWTNAVHLALDAQGHVLGGTIPLSGTRIEALSP